MSQSYLIEVAHKGGVTDPVGKGLAYDIVHLGLGRVKSVSSAQLYRLEGTLSIAERKRIASDLLCDPILQEYRGDASPAPAGRGRHSPGAAKASFIVDIWYKPGVTDAIGDSVRKGIQDLNIHGVLSVRTGTRYRLEGVGRKEAAEKIALALLVNPLVHESTISAGDTPADLTERSVRHAH